MSDYRKIDKSWKSKATMEGAGVRLKRAFGYPELSRFDPLGEPIVWYGPIVMNTKQELETAFQEYREGAFITQREMES